ncbi:MAG: hypothetical protein O3B95_10640 [Chloroflexi bacterium]|nr:hypothetical protein [Chloroflexota bacterium]
MKPSVPMLGLAICLVIIAACASTETPETQQTVAPPATLDIDATVRTAVEQTAEANRKFEQAVADAMESTRVAGAIAETATPTSNSGISPTSTQIPSPTTVTAPTPTPVGPSPTSSPTAVPTSTPIPLPVGLVISSFSCAFQGDNGPPPEPGFSFPVSITGVVTNSTQRTLPEFNRWVSVVGYDAGSNKLWRESIVSVDRPFPHGKSQEFAKSVGARPFAAYCEVEIDQDDIIVEQLSGDFRAAASILPDTTSATPTAVAGANPTAVPGTYWNIDGLLLTSFSCTDFHPGVLPLEGPSRWYQVDGVLTSVKNASSQVIMRLEIVSNSGLVLSTGIGGLLQVPANSQSGFSESIDLPSAPTGSVCRLTFTEQDFHPDFSGVVTTTVAQLFAP